MYKQVNIDTLDSITQTSIVAKERELQKIESVLDNVQVTLIVEGVRGVVFVTASVDYRVLD